MPLNERFSGSPHKARYSRCCHGSTTTKDCFGVSYNHKLATLHSRRFCCCHALCFNPQDAGIAARIGDSTLVTTDLFSSIAEQPACRIFSRFLKLTRDMFDLRHTTDLRDTRARYHESSCSCEITS